MIVLPDHHVVAAAGLYKEDGCHTTEAVGSHTGFTAVAGRGGRRGASTSNACELTLPTWNLVSKIPEVRMPQQSQVLVAWQVVSVLDRLDPVQEVLGSLELAADTCFLILPQSLDMRESQRSAWSPCSEHCHLRAGSGWPAPRWAPGCP